MNLKTKPVVMSMMLMGIGLSINAVAQQTENAANENQATTELALEEIIVTARKRSESLQDSPLSIYAITADQIDKRGIKQLSDIVRTAPGVAINSSGSISTNAVVIRGINQPGGIGQDTNVAVFVDGVYISGRDAAFMPMMGMERVEVVRGPQSALYGRNAFAGAINYITKKPSQEFEGDIEFTVGGEGQQGLKARFAGQLAKNLYASIDIEDSESGSTHKADNIDEYLGSLENESARARIIWEPTDNLDFDLTLTHLDILEQPQAATEIEHNSWRRLQGVFPFPAPVFTISDNQRFSGTVVDSPITGVLDEAIGTSVEADRGSLTINFETDRHQFSSITGVNDSQTRALTGYDSVYTGDYYFAAPAVLGGVFNGISSIPGTGRVNNLTGLLPPRVQSVLASIPAGPGGIALWQATGLNYGVLGGQPNQNREEFSQEFRISSNYDGKFNWLAGVSYSDLDLTEWLWSGTLNAGDPLSQFLFDVDLLHTEYNGGDPLILSETDFSTEVTSVYFSAEYEATDKLAFTVEGRYTEEDRSILDIENNFISPTLLNAGFNLSLTDAKDDWSFFSPRVTVSYKWDEDTLMYADVGRGTKSGGFNGGAVGDEAVYDEETNTTFEIGAKRTVLDGRGFMNISAYFIDWDNQQIRDFSSVPAVGVPRVLVTNLGKTEIKGLELDTGFQVSEEWTFHFAYTYNDSKVKEGILATDVGFVDFAELGLNGVQDGCGVLGLSAGNPTGICGGGVFVPFPPPGAFVVPPGPNPAISDGDTAGNQSPNTHKHTVNTGFRFTKALNNGLEFYTSTDVVWKDERFIDAANTIRIDDFFDVNVQLGLSGESWFAKINVSNLFGDDTPVSAFRPGVWDGSFQQTVVNRNDRMTSLSVGYKF